MRYNCLIVDDEKELADATKEYFQMFDLSCHVLYDGNACLDFLEKNEVDLLLLDINLEKTNGFVLCKKIREKSDLPILFISARQSDDDVLIALNIGGDDYIKKPYSLSILTAKVKAILKRNTQNKQIKSYNNIQIDENRMLVIIDNKEIQLKSKEFKLFQYLFENKNKILTKDELFNYVWKDTFFSDGTLNVHIRRIREKIEEDPNNPKYIKTIWGTGYMLEI